MGPRASKVYFVDRDAHRERPVVIKVVVLVPNVDPVDAQLHSVEQTECEGQDGWRRLEEWRSVVGVVFLAMLFIPLLFTLLLLLLLAYLALGGCLSLVTLGILFLLSGLALCTLLIALLLLLLGNLLVNAFEHFPHIVKVVF